MKLLLNKFCHSQPFLFLTFYCSQFIKLNFPLGQGYSCSLSCYHKTCNRFRKVEKRNCHTVQFQWALSGVTVAVKTWLLWHCLLPFAGISTKTFTNWVQLVAASFVLSRYVNDINDIVKIGWLPVRQQRDFRVLKLVHKALHSPSWLSYIPLDTVKHLRSLWSGTATGAPFKTLLPSYLMSSQQI